MKNLRILLTILLYLTAQHIMQAQQQLNKTDDDATFTIKGLVREVDTYNPVVDVNIQVNGGSYTSTSLSGEFRINVKIGDEIMISHKDFETIYYTVKSHDDLTVEVHALIEDAYVKKIKTKSNSFKSTIDSAVFYKKISAEKSIQFITESIPKSTSVKQNAEAFEVLADVYMYWKQYDLAVTNYRISLNNVNATDVNLKLAKAYFKNKNHQESLAIYNSLKTSDLSNWQNVIRYEGLGDVYAQINQNSKATQAYTEGLKIATTNQILPKITDLNSKLGEVYNSEGNKAKAEVLLENSEIGRAHV